MSTSLLIMKVTRAKCPVVDCFDLNGDLKRKDTLCLIWSRSSCEESIDTRMTEKREDRGTTASRPTELKSQGGRVMVGILCMFYA